MQKFTKLLIFIIFYNNIFASENLNKNENTNNEIHKAIELNQRQMILVENLNKKISDESYKITTAKNSHVSEIFTCNSINLAKYHSILSKSRETTNKNINWYIDTFNFFIPLQKYKILKNDTSIETTNYSYETELKAVHHEYKSQKLNEKYLTSKIEYDPISKDELSIKDYCNQINNNNEQYIKNALNIIEPTLALHADREKLNNYRLTAAGIGLILAGVAGLTAWYLGSKK